MNIRSHFCRGADSRLSGNDERAKGIEPSYAAWEATGHPIESRHKPTLSRFVPLLGGFWNFDLSGRLAALLRRLLCRFGSHAPWHAGGGEWICLDCGEPVDDPAGWFR